MQTHTSIMVNGQFPGPSLEVNNGDTLVIHVTNKARYNVTIHWHDVRQMTIASAYGPEFIMKCPIKPGVSYTYMFTSGEEDGGMHTGNFQKHLWLSIVETGFEDLTFVYFEDERDAEDAINALDNTAFGYDKRKGSISTRCDGYIGGFDMDDEDFVADNDDDGSPSDDSGGDDSDGSASGGGQEIIPEKVSKKEALASKTSLSKKKNTDEGSSKKKKQKRKKDPNAPKRAMSGFMFFSQLERQNTMEKALGPGRSHTPPMVEQEPSQPPLTRQGEPSQPLLTRQEVIMRNDGSMTLEQAAARFNESTAMIKKVASAISNQLQPARIMQSDMYQIMDAHQKLIDEQVDWPRLQAFYELNQNDTTSNSAPSDQFPSNSETLLLEINPSNMTELDNISA
ncbi:laccase-12-like protein [Tanacetum coccineum]